MKSPKKGKPPMALHDLIFSQSYRPVYANGEIGWLGTIGIGGIEGNAVDDNNNPVAFSIEADNSGKLNIFDDFGVARLENTAALDAGTLAFTLRATGSAGAYIDGAFTIDVLPAP